MDPYSNIRLPPNVTLELVGNNAYGSEVDDDAFHHTATEPTASMAIDPTSGPSSAIVASTSNKSTTALTLTSEPLSSPPVLSPSSSYDQQPQRRRCNASGCSSSLSDFEEDMESLRSNSSINYDQPMSSSTTAKILSTLEYLGMDKSQLLTRQIKDLNSLFKANKIDKKLVTDIKQYRRTLKNRKYALKSRESRQINEATLKEEIRLVDEKKRRLIQSRQEIMDRNDEYQRLAHRVKNILASNYSSKEIDDIKINIINEMKEGDNDFDENIYDMVERDLK